MPSFLGFYQGAATNREMKFERAVTSFLHQSYQEKTLIIISDGCEITNNIVRSKFPHDCIKLISIDKEPLFSGKVRQAGLNEASGDIITYLDSDDMYENENHLECIYNAFLNTDIDWVYFDDIVKWNPHVSGIREVFLEQGRIGTSNIAHRKFDDISWNGMNEYGHDWLFINNMIKKYKNIQKITGTSYAVCHIPNVADV